jgi:hypothetical protein
LPDVEPDRALRQWSPEREVAGLGNAGAPVDRHHFLPGSDRLSVVDADLGDATLREHRQGRRLLVLNLAAHRHDILECPTAD